MSGWRNSWTYKKAFFALSLVRSLENFKQEDRDNSNAHSVVYNVKGTAYVVP